MTHLSVYLASRPYKVFPLFLLVDRPHTAAGNHGVRLPGSKAWLHHSHLATLAKMPRPLPLLQSGGYNSDSLRRHFLKI